MIQFVFVYVVIQLTIESCILQMQVQGPFRFVKIRSSQLNIVHRKRIKMWDFDEIVRYTLFLNQYLKTNRQNSIRKLQLNDFNSMSKLVKSRNVNQCRIFHAKLMKIGQSLQEIFSLLSSKIDQYSLIYKKFKETERLVPMPGEVDKIEDASAEEVKTKLSCAALSQDEPQICGNNCCRINLSLLDFKLLTKEDWYQQLDDFLARLNNSWLDDI